MRLLVLVACVVLLVATGHGELAPPPLGSVDDLHSWLDARDTATVVLAVVRLLALAASAWLATVVAVSAAARALGFVRVAAAAERVLPRSLRRLAAGLAGTGLALAVASPPGQAAAATVVAAAQAPDRPAPMTMRALTTDGPAPARAPHEAVPDDVWVVAPGESFWAIAESVVGDAVGRAPLDGEVEPYWRALIDANLGRLVSDNPDLIVPGQELVLPPVP